MTFDGTIFSTVIVCLENVALLVLDTNPRLQHISSLRSLLKIGALSAWYGPEAYTVSYTLLRHQN